MHYPQEGRHLPAQHYGPTSKTPLRVWSLGGRHWRAVWRVEVRRRIQALPSTPQGSQGSNLEGNHQTGWRRAAYAPLHTALGGEDARGGSCGE